MRLFVSVEPAPAARAALAAALDDVDLGSARLVSPERWHITLAFLGEIAEDRVPALNEPLAEIAATAAPFQLRLSDAGVFPAGGRPAVLWVGLSGDIEPLRRLAGAVAKAMQQAGVDLERRGFTPHLTVARYRNAPVDAAAPAVVGLALHSGPEFAVAQIHLVRSRLGPRPRHEPVATWPLSPQRSGGAS